jgi:hypothetical protein
VLGCASQRACEHQHAVDQCRVAAGRLRIY